MAWFGRHHVDGIMCSGTTCKMGMILMQGILPIDGLVRSSCSMRRTVWKGFANLERKIWFVIWTLQFDRRYTFQALNLSRVELGRMQFVSQLEARVLHSFTEHEAWGQIRLLCNILSNLDLKLSLHPSLVLYIYVRLQTSSSLCIMETSRLRSSMWCATYAVEDV